MAPGIDLRGHVALFTGGNHGIGAATARALAAAGARVLVSYLRLDDEPEEVEEVIAWLVSDQTRLVTANLLHLRCAASHWRGNNGFSDRYLSGRCGRRVAGRRVFCAWS